MRAHNSAYFEPSCTKNRKSTLDDHTEFQRGPSGTVEVFHSTDCVPQTDQPIIQADGQTSQPVNRFDHS